MGNWWDEYPLEWCQRVFIYTIYYVLRCVYLLQKFPIPFPVRQYPQVDENVFHGRLIQITFF